MRFADLFSFCLKYVLIFIPLAPIKMNFDFSMPSLETRLVEHPCEKWVDWGSFDLRHEDIFFFFLRQLLLLLVLKSDLSDSILCDQLLDSHCSIQLQVDI